MLLGQYFRRRHKGSLIAIGYGDKDGINRNDRLAGTNVSLEQSVHGIVTPHVSNNFTNYPFLGVGKGEWNEFADVRIYIRACLERNSRFFFNTALSKRHRHFQDKQFVVNEPCLCPFQRIECLWKMDFSYSLIKRQ